MNLLHQIVQVAMARHRWQQPPTQVRRRAGHSAAGPPNHDSRLREQRRQAGVAQPPASRFDCL